MAQKPWLRLNDRLNEPRKIADDNSARSQQVAKAPSTRCGDIWARGQDAAMRKTIPSASTERAASSAPSQTVSSEEAGVRTNLKKQDSEGGLPEQIDP